MVKPRELVPVTMVKEFAWCPAIPWIMYNYGVEPPITPSMRIGIEFQNAADKLSLIEKLELEPPIEYQVYLEDRELGLYGVVDALAGKKRKTIVEVKAFRRNIRKSEHFKVQLYVYALLALRKGIPVEKMILLLGKEKYEIMVIFEELRLVEKMIRKLWTTVLSPEPPRVAKDDRKCGYCRYRHFCIGLTLNS